MCVYVSSVVCVFSKCLHLITPVNIYRRIKSDFWGWGLAVWPLAPLKLRSTEQAACKMELGYSIPRLHPPANSPKFSEISTRTRQCSCRTS